MPKKDFIWRGEEIIVRKDSSVNTLADGLNEVFKNGFRQTDLDTEILSKVFKPLPATYITASSTKCSDGDFIGRDNEFVSAGTYGYIYLVEAKNITTIDVPKEKGSYAIVSKIDPSLIVGAMPSVFVAFALNIPEQSFITNPAYCGKIKQIIGEEFSLIVPERLPINPSYLSEVYQRYLQADELGNRQASSLGTASSRKSVSFFQNRPDTEVGLPETQASPHP